MLATACLLLLVWGLLYVLSKIKKLWIQHFHPLFYDPQERRRAERRRRFAEHLKAQLNLLNSREAWQDYRFAELEAEVEAEGSRSNWFSLFSAGTTQGGLRREKSLSAALKASKERLILVEGEPGSGKSVALRHVANELADRASRSRSVNCLVPL
jgi:polyphosphate kinase 2 (PPK2 family)